MQIKSVKVAIGKETPGMMQCGGCSRPILDRFLLNVLDRAWHIQCVQCSDCGITLTEKCFSRDGKLFCKSDFFRRFGTKCAGCSLGISPSDLVRRARNKVFHLKCFTCMMCRKELSTGEELYILDENKFICKEDYISSKLSGSDIEDDGDFENVLEHQDNLSDRDFPLDNDHLDTKSTALLQNVPIINPNNENPLLNNHHPMLNKSDLSNSPGSPGHIKDEPMDHLSDSCPSPRSPDSQIISNINPGSNCSSMETNDNNNNKDGTEGGKAGSKRRGPRTTIKAKQLEVLKASFNATPKPTRHIREQLAQETGLNMRVIQEMPQSQSADQPTAHRGGDRLQTATRQREIKNTCCMLLSSHFVVASQVWFQNRRSKERRMKQLSALGARRHFFRGPRRMRALRAGMSPSELEESELMGPGFGYYNDNGQEFFPGYQGYGDFYPGPVPEGHPMGFLPPSGRGTPPLGMEHPLSRVPMGPESQYLPPDMMPQSGSPEPLMAPEDQYGVQLPPRSLAAQFTSLPPNHPDIPSETW